MNFTSFKTVAACVATVGLLAACGITKPSGSGADGADTSLRDTATKASNLTELELQAYTRNTLLRFQEAEQNYQEVIRLADDLRPRDLSNVEQQSAEAMSLLLHLALNKSNLGQHDRAEEFFSQSRTIVQEYGAISEAAKPDLFYAQHWMNQRQYDRAIGIAQDALRTVDALLGEVRDDGTPKSFDRIMLLRQDDGSLRLNQREADLANSQTVRDARFDGKSRQLTERQRLFLQKTHAHYLIARALGFLDRPEAQIDAEVDSAYELLQKVPGNYGRWLRAEIAGLRADRFGREKNFGQAVAELSGAIELLRNFQTDTRPEALLWLKKGEYQIEAGDGAGAREAYSKALKILQNGDEGLELKQVETVIGQLLIRARTGDEQAARDLFKLMQKVRSSATAQTVSQLSARLSSGDSAEAQKLRQIQDLERKENVLRAQFARLLEDPDADLHRRRVLSSKLSETSKNLKAIRATLSNPQGYSQLVDETIELDEAKKLMAEGEVMAVIQLGENSGLVGIVTKDLFTAYEIDLSIESAAAEVEKFRRTVDAENLVRLDPAINYGLFKTMFEPVKDIIKDADHLVVVPTGPLLSMPFNTLVVEEYTEEIQIVDQAYFDYSKVKWLGAQAGVTTAVSISSFFLGRGVSKPSLAQQPFIGFGDFRRFGDDEAIVSNIIRQRDLSETCRDDVSTLGSLSELDGTLEELRKIQGVLKIDDKDVILGEDFTDSKVKEANLKDFRVLHFATHGVLGISEECLPEPGLITSVASDGDAILEASEILDLKLDADLVVMSACDTGKGAGAVTDDLGLRGTGGRYAEGGEGLNGLARAFFFAGARNVLSTLWEADDETAQELMVLFYDTASGDEPVSIAEAMRKSQETLIKAGEFSHPYFWAPFATIGDGAKKLRFDQTQS